MHGAAAARMRNISRFAFRAMQHARQGPDDAGGAAGEAAGGPVGGAAAPPASGAGAMGSWQVHALDWAMDPAGRVSLIEANAAPGMRGYRSMPTLTPALWTTMFELVALAQSAPAAWLRGCGRGFRFHGWHLIYNELDEQRAGGLSGCEPLP